MQARGSGQGSTGRCVSLSRFVRPLFARENHSVRPRLPVLPLRTFGDRSTISEVSVAPRAELPGLRARKRGLTSVAIRKLLDFALHGRQQTCEACQGSFTCGPLLGICWCAKETLPQETRRQLKEQYRGCLCPTCLRNAGQREGKRDGAFFQETGKPSPWK
jgi:hypothetical protein